ncbi:hypothetical protein AVEN_63200-1 [Araneus ventricosus]|uniref:Uncharacterized protein n=1 Tax=Araneus ventricosus TaxID=182803 RepID=A0A4Y2B158_ARAVE|nr:hypothetical protein AVEN_63200-1 [Araneus ventricosus]
MADGGIDVPSKWKLRSVNRFLKAEGWFAENDQCSCSCQTLRRLRRAILTSGAFFVHYNAHPHSAVVTQQLLERFKWTCLFARRIAIG